MKTNILVILLLLVSLGAWSQSKYGYSCVVDSLNRIEIPNGESERLDNFYDKLLLLVRSGDSQISVLHIGGSHIQADIISHQIRTKFSALVPECKASRGLIFPYEAAKTNNPSNYRVTHKGVWQSSRNVRETRIAELGLTGIATTTTDPTAEISVNLSPESENHRWKCTKLTLIGYPEHKLVRPVLKALDTVFVADYDSVSATYVYNFPKPIEQFTVKIQQLDSVPHAFTVNGFLPETNSRGVVYHAVGVNGASVPSYLSCEHFERDLKLIRPDLIVFAIGINDASNDYFTDSLFVSNYDSLITKIERVVPNCAYIFVTNNDSFRRVPDSKPAVYEVNRNGLIAHQAFYELACKHHGGVWDMFEIMGGLSSMRQWEAMGLAQKDKVHFTRKGYKLLGDMFYSALINSYNSSMMKR